MTFEQFPAVSSKIKKYMRVTGTLRTAEVVATSIAVAVRAVILVKLEVVAASKVLVVLVVLAVVTAIVAVVVNVFYQLIVDS